MFAGVAQAPSEREIERQFNLGKLRGAVFKDLAQLDDGTQVKAGDAVRFVILNDPSFLDSLWDSAQDNAEEKAEELEAEFSRLGIVAHQRRVQGAEMSTQGQQPIEVYVLEYEIDAVLETWDILGPMDPTVTMAGMTAPAAGTVGFWRWMSSQSPTLVGVLGVSLAFTAGSVAMTVSGSSIEGTFFWIAVAAVAVSIAYSIGKLKGAPSS